MTKTGWRTVLLREETVSRIEKLKEQREAGRPRKIALGALIEDLIWPVLEADEVLRRYGPYLQEFAVDEDKIMIKDNRNDQLAELTFRNGVLYCSLDHSDSCVHIGFAWAIPKVYKVMEAHGKRMPKVKKV
jgi:hypothetical protein